MSDTFYEIVVPDGVAPGQAFQASVGGMLMVQQQLEPREYHNALLHVGSCAPAALTASHTRFTLSDVLS